MENREQMKETDRKIQETDRLVKENSKQIGGLHNSFGELAEHLVAPGIVDRFEELGIHITSCARKGLEIFDARKKIRTEIDILLENRDYLIGVEIKSKPAIKDIDHHIKRLELLREYSKDIGDSRKILGAIAGAIFLPEVKKAVLEAGLYVLVQSGDTMKIEVPEGPVSEW